MNVNENKQYQVIVDLGRGMCSIDAMVTCEIKLFQNYFSFHRHPSEIILFQRKNTRLKLFQNYFRGLLLQLMSIFQHVQCR